MSRYFLLLLFAFLLITPPLVAQEQTQEPLIPTETPLPSPTLEPSFTPLPTASPTELATATLWPSETPTATFTASATATVTETGTVSATQAEVTPELTAELTAEVTAETTELVTATGTSTATATTTSTQDPSLNAPYTVIAYYDAMAFLDGQWGQNTSWQLLEREAELWIATSSDENIETWLGTGKNIAIETSFALPTGTLSLSLRNSASGNYRLDLDSSGNLSLWRGTVLVSSNIVAPLGTLEHSLKFSANEGQITVELNGNMILAFSDNAPLPIGSVDVKIQTANGFMLRELKISMAQPEFDAFLATLPTVISFEVPEATEPPERGGMGLMSFNGSNDLNSILYDEGYSLYLINMNNCVIDGIASCPHQPIETLDGLAYEARWSPDRSQILFFYQGAETNNIRFLYVMQAQPLGNLNNARRITNLTAAWNASWSFNGTQIAVDSNGEIYIIDYVACSVGNCTYWNWTNTPTFSEGSPQWSPDGRILFESNQNGTSTGDREIYAMNFDHTGLIQITNNSGMDYSASWSPNNQQIAFASNFEVGIPMMELYIYNLADQTTTRLTNNLQWSVSPIWSPNGTKIALYQSVAGAGGGGGDIYIIDLSTEAKTPLRISTNDGTTTHASDWGGPYNTTPPFPPNPTVIPTAVPTAIPTNVPPVSWPANGEVIIDANSPIPVISPTENRFCLRTEDRSSRGPCALYAYENYVTQLGGSITWGQFAALVMYSEGHSILLGQNQNGNLVLGNPQVSEYGTCWNRVSGTWVSGSNQCSVSSAQYAPGVQRDFPYTVWEWIFKDCAAAAGFTNYMRNGVAYQGQCTEAGFLTFLNQVQTLYTDQEFDANPNLYLPLAQSEFALWHFQDGDTENERYEYGVCPCTWGNVATQDAARITSDEWRTYNNFHSYSYFQWNLDDAPDPGNLYFKLY